MLRSIHARQDVSPTLKWWEQYEAAIENLQLGMTQLVPDGNECAICGDGGHQAMECGRNPLLAIEYSYLTGP